MPETTVTLRSDLATSLDELAVSTGRSREELVDEAISRFLDYERWAVKHIKEGLRQADAGEFASDEEMAAIFDRYRDAATPS
jgi:predicted transcriptional regulator